MISLLEIPEQVKKKINVQSLSEEERELLNKLVDIAIDQLKNEGTGSAFWGYKNIDENMTEEKFNEMLKHIKERLGIYKFIGR